MHKLATIVLFTTFANVLAYSSFLGELNNIESFDHIEPFMFESLINQTLENLKKDIPDPLPIDMPLNIPLSMDFLTGWINLTDTEIKGVNTFHVSSLNFNLFTSTLKIVLQLNLNITTYNEMDTVLIILPVYGSGVDKVDIKNMEVSINTKINLKELSLETLSAETTFGEINVVLKGIFNDDEISEKITDVANELCNTTIVPYINKNKAEIGEFISPILLDAINNILHGDTTTDVPTSTV